QSGADTVFSSDTPDQLRIAMLMALMRSRQIGPATLVDARGVIDAVSEASWRLQDKGWTLRNPHGVAITLTTSERAFMQALSASVDRNVSRTELLRAIGGDEASKAGSGANRRLGV